jgi:VWFA-related protein
MIRAAAALMALVVAAPPPGAQQATFSSRRESVRVDVLVTDRGTPVQNLGPGDFELLDAGVPQQIELVSFDQIPIDLVLTLDGSVSISAQRLGDLRQGGLAALAGLRADDQAALLTFTDAVMLHERLTPQVARVRDAIAQMAPPPERSLSSGTALIDASYTAMTLIDGNAGRGLLIAFTDGVDTSSWLPAERVLQAASRSNMVAYGVSTSRLPRGAFLRELSDVTGGSAIEIPSTDNLPATFARILDEFRHRYLISFSPANVPGAGWHPLTVRVKNRRVDVKARAGYVR